MNDFNADLNAVLRYSMNTVENMLQQMQTPEHNHTRWGGPEADHTFRGVLADAIDESDRPHSDKESSLLRNPDQHVMVHEGRVRPAKFTDRGARNAERHTLNYLEQWGGEPIVYPDIGWTDESGHPRYQNPDLWENEQTEPEGVHPYGTLEVTHFHPDQSQNQVHHLHYSELGPHLGGVIKDLVDSHWDERYYPNHPADADFEHQNSQIDTYDRHLDALRNAPYEQIDTGHHTERDNGFGLDMPGQTKL